ncbi:cupin domain-containing protein [Paraburkholderia adhaesiva]|uniref:cupin domain-containing protein n=1 Tax=Paraburkholderia adhaesiva TaxID=2883244 RepID=UPI001F16971F|nr:cupin domain-containing protein [Paraburkholderia adhaesiva]
MEPDMSAPDRPGTPAEAFVSYRCQHGLLAPSLVAWNRSLTVDGPDDTHFGYVYQGHARLRHRGRCWRLRAGDYFCAPGPLELEVRYGRGILMKRADWRGLFLLGGPVEHKGRLRYIDQCSDTTLIQPVRRGDPCVNLLYFPPGVMQTAHTHPSDRLGLVLSGYGHCIARNHGADVTIALLPGMIFRIAANGRHHFATGPDDELRVLAYHPDSDCGPTDDDHAMINRTLVDGVPARELAAIRTRGDTMLEHGAGAPA